MPFPVEVRLNFNQALQEQISGEGAMKRELAKSDEENIYRESEQRENDLARAFVASFMLSH